MAFITLAVTREMADTSVVVCSGENGIDLDSVNQDNWVQKRNEFLSNVQHNGGRSHRDIIHVLIWFNRFAD
jgi:hypothetical protein